MDFAFLVHARDYTDVERKFKIAKYLPKWLVEFWCLRWPPVLVSVITGLKTKETGEDIKGFIIGLPMTAKQMMDNRELARKRVVQAIKKAEKLGARIVGLGALTSSVTGGGEIIKNKVRVGLTTGNTLTTAVSFTHIWGLLKNNASVNNIAIVGATGSIGQALARLLVKKLPDKSYLLYARTKENLDNLLLELKNGHTKIDGYLNNLDSLNGADLVVVATSAPQALIKSRHLKQNTIIYDVTQPQNIDKNTLRHRRDLVIYDGGLVSAPMLKSKLPFGLPDKVIFSCLGETIALAINDHQDHYFLGKVKPENVSFMDKLASACGINPVNLEI